MSTLSPAMDTALAAPVALMFGAVEIALPDYTLRLVDGAGFVDIGGHRFVGRDDTFGTLGGITDFTDGVDEEAPSFTLTLLPPSNTAMAALAAPEAQGATVTLYEGVVDPASGQVVGDPDVPFVGDYDVPTNRVGQGSRRVEVSVVSGFDRFFDADEGARLNNGFLQSIWPGAKGLEYVSYVQRQLPWGTDGPRPSLVTYATSGAGVGGGLGGGVFDGGVQTLF